MATYGQRPVPVAQGITFAQKVIIDLPDGLNHKMWNKLATPDGWRKRRSAYKDRVTYTCQDISKQLTVAQWEEIRATVLMITEVA